MSLAPDIRDHYAAELRRVEQTLPGRSVGWLRAARRRAFERFAAMGFPTARDEDWKYTRLTAIERRMFRSAERNTGVVTPASLEPYALGAGAEHLLVFVNGYYAPELSRPGRLPGGVTVGSLAAALDRPPAALEPHLTRYAEGAGNAFAALNTAFTADGAYIFIPEGVAIEAPVHLLFVSTGGDGAVFTHPRNLVIAGPNSRIILIESYAGLSDGYMTNALTEIVQGKGARVERYKLQQEGDKAVHISTLDVHQQHASELVSRCFSLGGGLARNYVNTLLDGEGAQCILDGLYLAAGRQHVDNHTLIDHAKPRATSREFYKGVLAGHARGVFNGRVVVHQDAQHTDAQQTNRNLLLSEDAEVDTKPQLEIYADDVKCSHGATVGQLDEDAVFYLRSRGMDEAGARSLLTYAFAADIIGRVTLAPVRARLEKLVGARLSQAQRRMAA